jgi:hypothetical protein
MSNSNKRARDNRANQLNPNNNAFRQSRGEPAAPTAPAPAPATSGAVPPGRSEKRGDSK